MISKNGLLLSLLVMTYANANANTNANETLPTTHTDNFKDQLIIENISNTDYIPEATEQTFNSLSELVEKHLVLRSKSIRFFEELSNHAGPITPTLLKRLHGGISNYSVIRDEAWEFIGERQWYVDKQTKISIETDAPTATIHDVRNHHDQMSTLRLNPTDKEGKNNVVAIKSALALALLLYDNFLVAIAPFQDSNLRPLINDDNPEHRFLLEKIVKSAHNIKNIVQLNRAITTYNQIIDAQKRHQVKTGKLEKYLDGLIAGSYMFSRGGFSFTELMRSRLQVRVTKASDVLLLTKNGLMNDISKVFGNTVGMAQSRHGKLIAKDDGSEKFKIPKTETEIQVVVDDMISNLRPLDVLFEKTPFRLTDKFIPGHWGHVAIWAGTKEQLIELGVWDMLDEWEAITRTRLYSPYTGPSFKSMIESNHLIIEALRPGVEINTPRHFLDIDDLGVTRPIDLSEEERITFLKEAFIQIGKEYDFNFDVETDKKIVCSEIAYRTFLDDKYRWPTTNTMNRDTISPDEVATLALPDSRAGERFFEPVLIYHDGKRLPDDAVEHNYQMLLELKYDEVRFQ